MYDIDNLHIHFRTATNESIRQIDLASFNFNCAEGNQLYDLKNLDSPGNVNSLFVNYTSVLNKRKFNEAIKSNQIFLPPIILSQFHEINEACKCLD